MPSSHPSTLTLLQRFIDAIEAYDNETAQALWLQHPGFDLNQANAHGETPLIMAASVGNATMVTYLLNHGAKVNAVKEGELTALDWAKLYGHSEIVALIKQHEPLSVED